EILPNIHRTQHKNVSLTSSARFRIILGEWTISRSSAAHSSKFKTRFKVLLRPLNLRRSLFQNMKVIKLLEHDLFEIGPKKTQDFSTLVFMKYAHCEK
ncbi:hypothetical protein L9F63_014696, partial [Diploptera punctata]